MQRCLEGISRDEPRLGTAMRVDGFLFTYIYPLNNWTCAVKKTNVCQVSKYPTVLRFGHIYIYM